MDRLSRDLLLLIAEKIDHHIDVLRVAVVSKQWHSVIMDNVHLLPQQLPLYLCFPSQRPLPLLMQCGSGDEWETSNYLCVSNNKKYSGSLLPEISRKWIAGSSNGWLIVIEIDGQEIQLLNPLTRALIPLPSLFTFQYPKCAFEAEYIYDADNFSRVILSGDPKRSDDCIVMAINCDMSVLSFCRLGDDKWTNIEGCPVEISDVIHYRGRFYAITLMGSLVSCDANVEVIVVGTDWHERRYLVESMTGDLLHVARFFGDEGSFTESFVVYKLQAVQEAKKAAKKPKTSERLYVSDERLVTTRRVTGFQWVKLESLGDQVVFLGRNSSLALSTDSVPGCRRNCIYFTDDETEATRTVMGMMMGSVA